MNSKGLRVFASLLTAVGLCASAPGIVRAAPNDARDVSTTTPIKHVVVIYQENVSFDHYFATYPHAANPSGEPEFNALDHTPRANNLLSGGLLDENPNSTQPFRLDPMTGNVTCDQNHSYTPEQSAFHHGLMDNFPAAVGTGNGVVTATTPPLAGQALGSPLLPGQSGYCFDAGKGAGLVMGYYDGNTVSAFWNYAQHFAMSDNSFSTMFGPSAPGALNLVAGTTSNATAAAKAPNGTTAASLAGTIAGGGLFGALIGDARPGFDECVTSDPGLQKVTTATFASTSKNVGDLLNAKGVTWGWFQGGFARTSINASGLAVCATHHVGLAGDDAVTQSSDGDYIPHHQPFMFYQSTANPHHNPPTPSQIGRDETGVNHQYDLTDFWTALEHDRLPAVSFLKAGAYQDGHAAYSDPLDEQTFVVQTINRLQQSNEWDDIAVIIAYDDSDGWYDHQMDPVVNQSSSAPDDVLAAPGSCGVTPAEGVPGRCGYGPRQPLLIISPWAKQNYIDHRTTDQSSILRFIEDNWNLGRIGGDSSDVKAGTLNGMFDFDNNHDRAGTLLLSPSTGQVISGGHDRDNRQ